MWKSVLVLILIIAPYCMQHDIIVKDNKRTRALRKVARITNGTKSLIGFFPFVGSLMFYGSHKCGAAIISAHWVLSAAHCCFYSGRIVPDNDMEISVGNVYWRDGEKHRVERKIYHEDYDADRVINDIAVMKVRVPFKFSVSVNTIKLFAQPLTDNVNDIKAVVLGWGQSLTNTSMLSPFGSDELLHVNVTIVNIKNCQKHYSDITSKNICVFTGQQKGSCTGDSGGPLVVHRGGHYMQVGVVSYGATCNNTEPEVYTRVSAYYAWIKSRIKKKRSDRYGSDDGAII